MHQQVHRIGIRAAPLTPAQRAVSTFLIAALLGFFTATALGCGGPSIVRRGATPSPSSDHGLVALAIVAVNTQRAEVAIDGPAGLILGQITRGFHLWVLDLPVGQYCRMTVRWMELRRERPDQKQLEPCIDVQPGTLIYAGHYQVGYGDRVTARPNRDQVEGILRADYPEVLARYPLR